MLHHRAGLEISVNCVCLQQGQWFFPSVHGCIFAASSLILVVKRKHWHHLSMLLMRKRPSWDSAPKVDILPWTSASVPVHQQWMSCAKRAMISILQPVLTWLGKAEKPTKKCKQPTSSFSQAKKKKKKISSHLDHWCLKIKVARGLSQAASIAGK